MSDLWPGFQGHDIFELEYQKNLKTKLLLHKRKVYLPYGMVLHVCLVTLTDVARVCQHQMSFLFINCCICDTVSAAVNHVTAAIRRVGLRCTSGRVVEYRSWDREVAGWNLTRGYCARQLSMLSLRDRLIYIYIYICIYIYIFKTKGQNRPLICPWKTAVKNMLQKSDRSHRKQMSTSESWGVNGHTRRCTSPVSVISQLPLVSDWELMKRRSAPTMWLAKDCTV